MKPTDEQERIMELAKTGRSMRIIAYAGTGKTTTLSMIAREITKRRGRRRGLYLAFNKSIASSAGAKFADTRTEARTFHSLAFRAIGHKFRDRLDARLSPKIVEERLGDGEGLGHYVLSAVRRFCHTTDDEICMHHVQTKQRRSGGDLADQIGLDDERAEKVLKLAKRIWSLMSDASGDFPVTHDTYLKIWALSDPKIEVDVIFFDEAQDADLLMRYVIEQQDAQVVWVGDPYQQLYSWRGAVDALSKVKVDETAYLTRSFRFGHEIAAVANGVLRKLGAEQLISGVGGPSSVVRSLHLPDAVLCRSNAAVMRELLQSSGRRIAITGQRDWQIFLDAYEALECNRRPAGPFALFRSLKELRDYAESDEGGDVKPMLDLVDEHGVCTIRDALYGAEDFRGQRADLVISTVHRAKGLEWCRVRLVDDFLYPGSSRFMSRLMSRKRSRQIDVNAELRIVYVALTRAKNELSISQELADFCANGKVNGIDLVEFFSNGDIENAQKVRQERDTENAQKQKQNEQDRDVVKERKKTRGGARPGAGRKPRWGVPTVAMRVPEMMRREIEQFIWDRLFGGKEPAQEPAQAAERERVAELEAEVEKLKASNERLLNKLMDYEHKLKVAVDRCSKLERDLERERTTRPIYLESGGQCQAATRSGKRCCRNQSVAITADVHGFRYEFYVCRQHYEQHKSGKRVVPALECVPER